MCHLNPPITLLSVRAKTVNVKYRNPSRGPITHVVVDATGLKVFGEGEWKTHKHGSEIRRTWRKLHLAIDASTHEVVIAEVSLVSVGDNSITLYERTFLFEDYNAPRSHNAFLAVLANVLPPGCCPLIVTDVGYRNTWFREIERHGWFWLGRVHGDVSFMLNGQTSWQSNKSLYPKANSTAKYMGSVKLARKSLLQCYLHLFKAKPKLRKDKRFSKAGRNHTTQKSYSLGSKEPWLLATNLPPGLLWPFKGRRFIC